MCSIDDIIGKDASLYKLSCEFDVLNACYDMGDIEHLTRKVETSHWKKEEISLHAAAKQASFSLQTKDVNARKHAWTKLVSVESPAFLVAAMSLWACMRKCDSGKQLKLHYIVKKLFTFHEVMVLFKVIIIMINVICKTQ